MKPGITSVPKDPKLSLLTPLAETCHKLLAWAAVRDWKGGVSPASGHHTLSDYRNYSSQIHSLALCSFLPYHAGLLFPLLSVSCSPFTGLTWYHYTKYMEDLPLKITLLPLHSLSALFKQVGGKYTLVFTLYIDFSMGVMHLPPTIGFWQGFYCRRNPGASSWSHKMLHFEGILEIT